MTMYWQRFESACGLRLSSVGYPVIINGRYTSLDERHFRRAPSIAYEIKEYVKRSYGKPPVAISAEITASATRHHNSETCRSDLAANAYI